MQERNPALVVVFSFLTLGIYGLYWIVTTQNALHRKTGMGSSGGTTILLSIVTFGIYGIYWLYLLGKEIRKAGGREDRSIVFLVLSVCGFGWVVPAIAQSDINDIIDRGGDDDDDDDDDDDE